MVVKALGSLLALPLLFFATTPSSTNFTLRNYDFGNGGGSLSSPSYKLNGSTGTLGGKLGPSTNYAVNGGLGPAENADVPPAPTLTNPSNLEYNRLKLVVVKGAADTTDTKYAIAISSDNFVTTKYVQTDNSIGSSYSISNYQLYAGWGGASGFFITGLTPGTTYKAKVAAYQGNFTNSAFGPATSGVATVQPSLTFGVATSPVSNPLKINFTGVIANTVTNAGADVVLSLTSNAHSGGWLYIKDTNAGLKSTFANNFLISSATADLNSAGTGYGGIVTSTSANSGSLASLSPFDGAGNPASNTVGGLSTALQQLISTAGPVDTGSATVRFKVKTTTTTPSEPDYADLLTFLAAMTF